MPQAWLPIQPILLPNQRDSDHLALSQILSPGCFFFYSCNLQLLSFSFVQKLAVLKDGFQLDSGSQQELWGSSPSLANSEMSIPRLYSDAGSQTDIPAEVSPG